MENLEGLEILENFISVWKIRESLEASLLVMKKKCGVFSCETLHLKAIKMSHCYNLLKFLTDLNCS